MGTNEKSTEGAMLKLAGIQRLREKYTEEPRLQIVAELGVDAVTCLLMGDFDSATKHAKMSETVAGDICKSSMHLTANEASKLLDLTSELNEIIGKKRKG